MVDYSKWKKIEISDDEDDTHPNIDTPSLFRWRHQARQEREYKFKEECKELEERKKNLANLVSSSTEAEIERAEIEKKEKELDRRALLRPYNVDSIGQETWESTRINSVTDTKNTSSRKEYTDEEFKNFEKFIEVNEKDLKDYSFLHGVWGSRRFILEHANLVSQFTVDWLTMRCVDYKLNGSTALLKHVAYQAVIIEMILDIAKSVGRGCDPRNCLSIFFDRYKDNARLIDGVIDEQVATFLERVDKGAEYRLEQAYEKQQEDDQPILGPGGLDPNEVFQELDPELQDAFLCRDMGKLQQAISKYPPEEAEEIFKRCIDAGLWMNSPNPDLEEFAESYEKEQQRLAALSEDIEPEPVMKVETEAQAETDEYEVRDVFSKLIINPNREVKKQPGLFADDDDDDGNKDKEVPVPEGDDQSDASSINEEYFSSEESDVDVEKKEKNEKEFEVDLDEFEGRKLTEEEQSIRDQLLDLVKKTNKGASEKKSERIGSQNDADERTCDDGSSLSENSDSIE